MATANQMSTAPIDQAFVGVIRGKTIELDNGPRLPDGQRVSVTLSFLDRNERPAWPDEAAAFAKEQHVVEHLPKVWDMTRRVFPAARQLNIRVDEDPEIADDKHIVFAVQVAGLSVDDAVAAQQRWCREIFECCPSTVVCIFRLDMRFAE